MKHFLQAGLAITALTAASFVNAATIYNVSSTPLIDCGDDPHGLWTNTYRSSSCNEYFDFQAGSTLTVDGSKAVLNATALNDQNITATINITFEGFNETYSNYKNGGTPDYDGTDNVVDWNFYNQITSGTIEFSNGHVFDTLLVGQSDTSNPSVGKPVLQIGDGANDKSGGFGASAWLDVFQIAGNKKQNGEYRVFTGEKHWDLNMSLTAVPEPASLALIGLGLAGLGFSRRNSKKA